VGRQLVSTLLAGWLAHQGAADRLGDPGLTGATVMAALKGLKTSSRTLGDYRAGQAMLARMLALALRRRPPWPDALRTFAYPKKNQPEHSRGSMVICRESLRN